VVIIGPKDFPKCLLSDFLNHGFRIRKNFRQQQNNRVAIAVEEGAKGGPETRDVDFPRVGYLRQQFAQVIDNPAPNDARKDGFTRLNLLRVVGAICRGLIDAFN